MEHQSEEDGGPVDISQFEGLPPRADLDLVSNGLALEAANQAAALKCSVLDILADWGISGTERDDLILKVQVLVTENNAYDREKMETIQAQRESERSQAPPRR